MTMFLILQPITQPLTTLALVMEEKLFLGVVTHELDAKGVRYWTPYICNKNASSKCQMKLHSYFCNDLFYDYPSND